MYISIFLARLDFVQKGLMLYSRVLSGGLTCVRPSVRLQLLVNTIETSFFDGSTSNWVYSYMGIKSRTSSTLGEIRYKMAFWRPF